MFTTAVAVLVRQFPLPPMPFPSQRSLLCFLPDLPASSVKMPFPGTVHRTPPMPTGVSVTLKSPPGNGQLQCFCQRERKATVANRVFKVSKGKRVTKARKVTREIKANRASKVCKASAVKPELLSKLMLLVLFPTSLFMMMKLKTSAFSILTPGMCI